MKNDLVERLRHRGPIHGWADLLHEAADAILQLLRKEGAEYPATGSEKP